MALTTIRRTAASALGPLLRTSSFVNTLMLPNVDLEQAYYKVEIVDAYARILMLAKQLGSVNTLSQKDMSELIGLKTRFGMNDPRAEEAKKGQVACSASDFLSRVASDPGTRGRMMCDKGVAPVAGSDADLEQLVQTITDQIMTSM